MFFVVIFFGREDRKKFARLVREKRINVARIDKLKERVEIMLEKKFGRHCSIVKLETLIVDPHVVELRQDQQDFALACATELREWTVRIYTVFHKKGTFFLSLVIHSNDDQFTQNFYQL